MIPLTLMKTGEKATVSKIAGSGHLARTLSHLGISIGEELVIIQKANESVIVLIRESRYALGAGAAGMVLVNPVGGAA